MAVNQRTDDRARIESVGAGAVEKGASTLNPAFRRSRLMAAIGASADAPQVSAASAMCASRAQSQERKFTPGRA